MAKTWENVSCRLWTQNTVNDRGNSEYIIFTNRMIRCAPINIDREKAQNQVYTFKHKSICYLDPKSHLYGLIKPLSLHERNKIKIDSVAHDDIYLNVFGVVLPASRIPKVGLATFDCINNNGDLNEVHLGHKVCKIE